LIKKLFSGISFNHTYSDELLEGTVDGRADVWYVLVEFDSGNSTLADALGSELKFLQ
jgi:hypothetical protein